jgi:hypothetical protein
VMTLSFKPATREASFARIALTGPSGSGKTWTALTLAFALSDRVAVIDTERGSASKYVGLNGWQFDTVQPDSFSPLSLVATLGVAAGEGYGVVVIDSLSHYWMGKDGMLEQVDKRSGSNKFTSGWKAVGPEETKMIDAILSYPGHIVATMRVKTEYVLEENEKGKKEPKKVGLKPIQRDGVEHEFDLVGDMDMSHGLTVSKSRIHTMQSVHIPLPGPELGVEIRDWLAEGDQIPTVSDYRKKALSLSEMDDFKALFLEVSSHRMANAPMVDDDGSPTVLGDYIRATATRVKASSPEGAAS